MGRANVTETEEQYLLQVAVPGLKREDLVLTARGSHLKVSGKRTLPERAGFEPGGVELRDSLDRSFQFSSQLDQDGIRASVANGLLTVVLPKNGARNIPVSSR